MLLGVSAAVVRWRKYGKDRLYVTGDDGVKFGYHDLATGQDHLEAPEWARQLREAVQAWQQAQAELPMRPPAVADNSPPVPEQRVAEPLPLQAEVEPPEPAAEVEWEDLATRRAGEMAREQAVALKQAAPVRTMLARVLGVHTDERAWRIGADGEEKVAAQLWALAKKDPRWRYLHAVPVGEKGADIDHLVIGPGGVYSLNAKHHPGSKVWVGGNTMMINGQRQPYIRNSRHEAARAAKLLTAACGFPVAVTGVVVPVGAEDVTVKSQPDDVYVVYRMALVRWLRGRPEALSDEQSDGIFGAARRSTTWQPMR